MRWNIKEKENVYWINGQFENITTDDDDDESAIVDDNYWTLSVQKMGFNSCLLAYHIKVVDSEIPIIENKVNIKKTYGESFLINRVQGVQHYEYTVDEKHQKGVLFDYKHSLIIRALEHKYKYIPDSEVVATIEYLLKK